MIFTPPQATAIHGAYNRTYLVSTDYTASAVRAVYRGVGTSGSNSFKDRKKLHLEDLSKIYRFLVKDDKTFLKSTSSKDLLIKIADTCSEELFKTHVLSRDMMTLSEDLSDAFCEMYEKLNQQQDWIPPTVGGESRQQCVNRTIANVMPLMELLDALQRSGLMDVSTMPAGDRFSHVGGERVLEGAAQRGLGIRIMTTLAQPQHGKFQGHF
ncbi:hypothetical protein PHYPSEUDO_011773 [Phytophthora pseudosyringae]|uniref:Uncharacterized protein n=1 Tax=Phytophthora pseudosyringae TaxID=221518 RepID=A0A8T1W945_9STRA|nr:hypothetical protein PHYPSEUDO_011773 [Phytophthora pseudosyringae]